METNNAPILTPDQRLRVFVSSTLHELAEERNAVKQAIQNIHLTPVMFELGARSHAPRNLYRQYLAQSQIFVGIYWDRYGWVAPEETISGLEDEYNLSGNMPKLIYIKNSQGQREERLQRLIDRIQSDDQVSYKTFNTAEELGNLIVNDLAVLLTERFNLTLQHKYAEAEFKQFNSIPAIANPIVGREENVKELLELLHSNEIRLVTLTGPGGIGKSRLAVEVSKRLQNEYRDGVAYVPLAPVKDHNLVPETISYHLGIKISGGNILDSLKLFLQDKKFLLVLDNFEQIMEASSIIDDLLYAAPGLKIIVTSRERLALSFEHVYTVPTLPAADLEHIGDPFPAAVELFVQRAKAVQPTFKVTDQNREIIYKICMRLEGLPLAIELAAAQINLFSPAMLYQRLEKSFDILKGSFRDIPERQKTIRNTIEWSYDLLSPAEQNLLLQISLYNAGSILQAVESMQIDGEEDVYIVLGSLINKSLLVKQDEETQVRYQMLESVREFAQEKLKEKGLFEECQQRQAEFYYNLLWDIKQQKNQIYQSELFKFLEKEHSNIRLALEYLLHVKDIRKVTGIAWSLWLFWWVNAHTQEGYTWMKKIWDYQEGQQKDLDDYTWALLATNVGTMSFLQRDFETYKVSLVANKDVIMAQNDDELVAIATLINGVVSTILKAYDRADRMLQMSLERFKKIGSTTGVSLVYSALGRNAMYSGQIADAKKNYKKSMDLARADKNEFSVILGLAGFALAEVMERNTDAKNYLRESLLLSQSLHFYEGLAWSIEIWALTSINENKIAHAVTLMGAVEYLRKTLQLPVWDDLQVLILNAKNQIQARMDPVLFTKAWNCGSKMTIDQMINFAIEK